MPDNDKLAKTLEENLRANWEDPDAYDEEKFERSLKAKPFAAIGDRLPPIPLDENGAETE